MDLPLTESIQLFDRLDRAERQKIWQLGLPSLSLSDCQLAIPSLQEPELKRDESTGTPLTE